MDNNTIIQILLGVLITISLTLTGWSLNQHFTTNARLATIDTSLDVIAKATDWKQSKDRQDTLHWKYLSWSAGHINKLYQDAGLPIPEGPDFD